MDYKILEEEIRHERELRKLHSTHLVQHDTSIHAIREILADTARIQQQTTDHLAKLTVEVANLQDLIRAITKDHRNGKEPEKL